MNTNFDQYLALFDYVFPETSVALSPAHPRDSAKLLVHDRRTGETTADTFRSVAQYLPPRSVLVLNDTKVLPARMELQKSTGGKSTALYLRTEQDCLRCLASGHLKPGDSLRWANDLTFAVVKREEKEVLLRPEFPLADFPKALQAHGHIPLPPYLSGSQLSEPERQEEYQTVFAKHTGAGAPPTAGLHFTPALLDALRAAGHETVTVTLHVGLGTFAPLTEEQWLNKELHAEWYEVSPEAADVINRAKAEGRPVVAVGTTVVRTLESAGNKAGMVRSGQGSTTLFLRDDDRLRVVDHLITNFHVPKSSLLMLVSVLTGREKLLHLYQEAIAKNFRLFSFGDAMLIL